MRPGEKPFGEFLSAIETLKHDLPVAAIFAWSFHKFTFPVLLITLSASRTATVAFRDRWIERCIFADVTTRLTYDQVWSV